MFFIRFPSGCCFASFKPVYIKGFNITIYAQKPENGSLKEVFQDMLNNRYWPVPLDKLGANITFRARKVKT